MQQAAFEQMVRTYQKLVYTVCLQLVRDPYRAEDLAQDTFLSAWSHLDTCPAQPKAWLCRIAVNKAKDFLKSAPHRRASCAELPVLEAAAPLSPSTELVAERQEVLRRAVQAVKNLQSPYLEVCSACLLENATVNETAQRLGRPAATVRTQLSRGRKLLQRELVEVA